MYDLVIFGTGKSCEKIIESINLDEARIVCFIDNNINKINKYYNETNILIKAVQDVINIKYDYIIIASIYPEAMYEQLLTLEIETSKIIQYFVMGKKDIRQYSDFLFGESIIYDVMETRLEKEIKRLESHIENSPYEIYDKIKHNRIYIPHVKSIKNTIDELLLKNYSLSRIGDGEFMLMIGKSINFQKYDFELANRLEEILHSDNDNCMIAISDEFGDLDFFLKKKSRDDIRLFMMSGVREKLYSKLNMEKVYGNAFVTRPYLFLNTKNNAEYYFSAFKSMWEEKEILIIEGERTYFGIGNDLLKGAINCERIIAPKINAYSCYVEIYNKTLEWLIDKKVEKCIVLAALGPTATVLAYDISKLGYHIIDIGHLDLEYEWYLKGVDEAIIIKNKYCDAVFGGKHPEKLVDETYEKQIINYISMP